MNDHDPTDRAVKILAKALYFDDDSDYGQAIWAALEVLAPDVADALEAHLEEDTDLPPDMAADLGLA